MVEGHILRTNFLLNHTNAQTSSEIITQHPPQVLPSNSGRLLFLPFFKLITIFTTKPAMSHKLGYRETERKRETTYVLQVDFNMKAL